MDAAAQSSLRDLFMRNAPGYPRLRFNAYFLEHISYPREPPPLRLPCSRFDTGNFFLQISGQLQGLDIERLEHIQRDNACVKASGNEFRPRKRITGFLRSVTGPKNSLDLHSVAPLRLPCTRTASLRP